jgi:hypothetical protein
MSDTDSTDLVCKARRAALSDDEQRRLAQLTRTDGETKLFGMMLQHLDRSSQVQRGDDALIARMTAHALRAAARPPRRRASVHGWLVAAPVMLAATVAGAFWAARSPSGVSTGQLEQAVTTERAARRPAAASVARHVAPSSPAPAPAAAELGTSVVTEQTGASHKTLDGARGDRALASTLFARANLLRREGHGREALTLYQTVVDRYPSAREAPPSLLALAKILEPSRPARALGHYQALAASSSVLRAEALWGVAETARRLAEGELERRALTELVRQFPNSAYAEAARGRLSHAP